MNASAASEGRSVIDAAIDPPVKANASMRYCIGSVSKQFTAAILVIGNEILSGKIADTNTAWAISRLREVGARLVGVTVVPDEVPVIEIGSTRLNSSHIPLSRMPSSA